MKQTQKSRLHALIENTNFDHEFTIEEMAGEAKKLTLGVLESRLVDLSQRVGEGDGTIPGFWMLDIIDWAGADASARSSKRKREAWLTQYAKVYAELPTDPRHISISEIVAINPTPDIPGVVIITLRDGGDFPIYATAESFEKASRIVRDAEDARTLPVLLEGLRGLT